MKKIFMLVFVGIFVFSVLSFAAVGSINIVGSTSVQPLAEELVKAYTAKNPEIKIFVQGGGSGAGIKAAMTGTADIGTSSRELKPEETGIVETTIAKDGIAIVVNKDNSVKDLKTEFLQKIYTGELKTWKEAAGPGVPKMKIVVVNREAGSGTRGAFEELVLGSLKNTSNCLVQSSTGAVQQTVAVTKEAVGYISLGSFDPSAVKKVTIDGVECTEKNILDKKYKLQRPFLMLTKTAPTGIVKEFLDWVLSPEGQKIVAKEYITVTLSK